MKTVQEWLKELDEEKLVSAYFYNFPIDYNRYFIYKKEATQLPLKTIRERCEAAFVRFIRMLKDLTPETPQEQSVFFTTKEYQEGHSQTVTLMCCVDDLLTQKDPDHYSWMSLDFEKVMGYWVANTELTQENIYDVLAYILEELSFDGYTPEEHKARQKRLTEMLKEMEGKTPEELRKESRPVEEFLEELRLELGRKPEKPDPEEKKRQSEILHAELEYSRYCFEREVAAVRALLRGM